MDQLNQFSNQAKSLLKKAVGPPKPAPKISKDVQDTTEKISASELTNTATNLASDTKSNPDLIYSTLTHVKVLTSRTKYGVLRCDYEYIPTRGDPGEASS